MRSALRRLDQFDAEAANALYAAMHAEAEAIVRRGAGNAPLTETRSAFMRYRGQGHEIAVPLPTRAYDHTVAAMLRTTDDGGAGDEGAGLEIAGDHRSRGSKSRS